MSAQPNGDAAGQSAPISLLRYWYFVAPVTAPHDRSTESLAEPGDALKFGGAGIVDAEAVVLAAADTPTALDQWKRSSM